MSRGLWKAPDPVARSRGWRGSFRSLKRALREDVLHRAKHEGLAAQNRKKRPNFDAWIEGMVAYVSMVNEKQGRELAAALAQVS